MMSVGVGGYMEQWFGMSSTDAKGKGGAAMEVNDGSAQQSDSEIHFKGKLEADNGMTFSVKIELEGNNQGVKGTTPGGNAAMIDESQLTIGGEFGAVTLGAEDGASVLTHHNVKSAGAVGLNCGDVGAWIQGVKGCGGGLETSGHQHGDRNNITYFSPRVNGFQFAGTYIPDANQEGGSLTGGAVNDRAAWSVGGNFVGEFGGTNLSVSLGHYQRSQMGMSAMIFDGMMKNPSTEANAPARVPGGTSVEEATKQEKIIADYKKALAEVRGGKAIVGEDMADVAKSTQTELDNFRVSQMLKADDRTFTNVGLNVGFGSFTFGVAYAKSDGGAYMVADNNRLMTLAEFAKYNKVTVDNGETVVEALAGDNLIFGSNGVVTDTRITGGNQGNEYSIAVNSKTGMANGEWKGGTPTTVPAGHFLVNEGQSYGKADADYALDTGEDQMTWNNTDNDSPATRMDKIVKDMFKDYDVISTSAMFTDGPMSVSLGYIMADYDNGDEHSLAELGVSYVMAPGVAWKSSLFMAEADNADGSMRDGTGFVTGFAIGF